MSGPNTLLPNPSELLHLNQACVQHFISYLTAWCPYDNFKLKGQKISVV